MVIGSQTGITIGLFPPSMLQVFSTSIHYLVIKNYPTESKDYLNLAVSLNFLFWIRFSRSPPQFLPRIKDVVQTVVLYSGHCLWQ